MMSVNDRLADAAVHHAVDLAQYSTGTVRRLIALLNRTDADLMAQLTTALATMDPASFTVERLDAVLQSVRALNVQAYQRVEMALTEELRQFAATEWAYQQNVLPAVGIPVSVSFASTSATQVYSAAMSRPFQGRLLSEWAKSIEADRMVRIRDAIRIGFVEGQTNEQIIRRIRGTRAKGYSDGIIEIDRRNAEAVVRTAVQHTAAGARDEMFRQNLDVIKAVRWSSTLDGRTTETCRIHDGRLYEPETHKPIGHSIPWGSGPGRAHWRCRSTAVAVVKSLSELSGIEGMPEFPVGMRASMDGAIPADVSYSQWIQKQSAARQDEIVGPARGKLMREGKLPFDSLYTDRGVYLTLDQLRERNAAAFKRAGV